jgi:phosphoserine phosphatase
MRVLRRHGLTRARFDDTLMSIDYNPGVPETLARLHEAGVRTAIVSGGFMAQARRAQIDHGIHHAYAAVDVFWDAAGSPVHWNIFPSDFEGKVDFVQLLMREYGFDTTECAFIGDGRNDVPIARRVGTSFALDGQPELRAAVTHAVDEFSEILRYLP